MNIPNRKKKQQQQSDQMKLWRMTRIDLSKIHHFHLVNGRQRTKKNNTQISSRLRSTYYRSISVIQVLIHEQYVRFPGHHAVQPFLEENND